MSTPSGLTRDTERAATRQRKKEKAEAKLAAQQAAQPPGDGLFVDRINEIARQWSSLPDEHPFFAPGREMIKRRRKELVTSEVVDLAAWRRTEA